MYLFGVVLLCCYADEARGEEVNEIPRPASWSQEPQRDAGDCGPTVVDIVDF